MLGKNETILSIGALVLAAAACGGASTPPSDTPASSGAGAVNATNVAGEETPGGQGAVSSTSEVGASEGQPPDPYAATDKRRPSPGMEAAQTTSGSDVSSLAASTSTALNDAQIAHITDGVHSAEIEQAKLAREKTSNPEVRRFASMMIDHHGEAKKKQAALKLGTAESPLSRQLADESKSTLESLKSKQGAEFDRAYLDAQVAGHQKVLDTIDRVLAPQAQKPELRSYLTELEPTVSQHLEQARSTLQSVQGGSGKTSSR